MVRRPEVTAALFVLFLNAFGLAQTILPADPTRSVRISGRLVTSDGHPIDFSVQVGEIMPDGLRDSTSLESDSSSGVFTFLGQAGTRYRFLVGNGRSTPPKTADTASGKDIDLGDMVLAFCPAVASHTRQVPALGASARRLLDEMVIEPQNPLVPRDVSVNGGPRALPFSLPPSKYRDSSGMTATESRIVPALPPCWSGPSLDRPKEWESSGMVDFHDPFRLESFFDGKVRSLRVVRYYPGTPESKIREEVGKIWLGLFSYVTSSITWDEGNFWNVEVFVEYDDGKRTAILTDGAHAEVEDRRGKYWFMRL